MTKPLICQRRANLTTALDNIEQNTSIIATHLYDAALAKHKQRGLEFNLSFEHVLIGVERGVCAHTGIPFDNRRGAWLPFKASLDRRDNTLGYFDNNVDIVAKCVNQGKGPWTLQDFDRMCISRCRQLGLIER